LRRPGGRAQSLRVVAPRRALLVDESAGDAVPSPCGTPHALASSMISTPQVATVLLVLAAACAAPREHTARPPLSAGEHFAEAERHEAEARALEADAAAAERTGAPTQATCGDVALSELTTSGTERLNILPPCWAGEASAIRRDRAHAAQLRVEARRHRIQARELVLAQQRWCAGLPEAELDHTPFDHREDLRAVQAELDGDRLRGARILFKPVAGLTAEWMRKTLACHQALAAAVGEPEHLAGCPSVIRGAQTVVTETPQGLEVAIRAVEPEVAQLIYARAEALLDGSREAD
jgi:hypothetical protein